MKKLLTRNLGLKLASLVLAFVLWFLVAQIYDPKDTVTFNNIQVKLTNTEQDYLTAADNKWLTQLCCRARSLHHREAVYYVQKC